MRSGLRDVLAVTSCLLLGSSGAAAQMPGVPVLQNAFVRGGFAVGGNYGLADDTDAYALAASWTPRNERFQVTAGVGALTVAGVSGSNTIGGARLSVPVRTRWTGGGSTDSYGVGIFAGAGSVRGGGGGVLHVPVGIAAAYRWRIGESRALSVHAAPHVLWARRSGTQAEQIPPDDVTPEPEPVELEDNATIFRTSVGADFTLTQRFGLTGGVELGSTAPARAPGPRSAIFGIGLSYSF